MDVLLFVLMYSFESPLFHHCPKVRGYPHHYTPPTTAFVDSLPVLTRPLNTSSSPVLLPKHESSLTFEYHTVEM